jgi:hypothetical protein
MNDCKSSVGEKDPYVFLASWIRIRLDRGTKPDPSNIKQKKYEKP